MLKGTATAVRRAKKLRREMTLPEIILWKALRARPGGHKFRHQHPAGDYDLDFYCDAAKLCIEVDGEAHERGDRPQRDARRDSWLAEHGIRTMRIPAVEVLQDLDAVIVGILHEIADIEPTTRRRNPPPSADLGEGDHSRADGNGGGASGIATCVLPAFGPVSAPPPPPSARGGPPPLRLRAEEE